jgi:hypothetical protein
MDAVAVAAFEPGLLVGGEGPVHALVIVVLVAGEAVGGGREFYRARAALDEMLGFRGMAAQAVAVIDVDLVLLVGDVARLAGFVGDGCRRRGQGLRQSRCFSPSWFVSSESAWAGTMPFVSP